MSKQTLAQEYQTYLYGLFQTHLMNLDGPLMLNDEQMPVIHVSRDVLMDKLLLVLNEFGESLNSDERFQNEIK